MSIKNIIINSSRDFVTVPLWEEGDYRLAVNVYKVFDELPSNIKLNQLTPFDLTTINTRLNIDDFIVYLDFDVLDYKYDINLQKVSKPDISYIVNFEIKFKEYNDSNDLGLDKLVSLANCIISFYEK